MIKLISLVVDGLQLERRASIHIDVGLPVIFDRLNGKFIMLDIPRHGAVYPQLLVTGRPNCDLAIILVDARAGVKPNLSLLLVSLLVLTCLLSRQ